jgi:uncharacterized membrane protein YbhN (UPF0104 family)
MRVGLVVAALVLMGLAFKSQWHEVGDRLHTLSIGWTALSMVFALLALVAIALIWREVLADLGSPLPVLVGCRVFLLAQLGKYIPGSVFAVAGQVELATKYDVPRKRSAAAGAVTLVLSLAVGGLVAIGSLPLLDGPTTARSWPVLLLLPLAALLHPTPLTAILNRALRLVRRAPLEEPLSGAGLARAAACGAASWVLLGLHIWALCRGVGASAPVLGLSIVGFAAAWVVGFVVVIAPAGFGPREAVLVAVLGDSLVGGSSAALLVAGLSRLLLLVGDGLLAALALAVGASPSQHRESAEPESPGAR